MDHQPCAMQEPACGATRETCHLCGLFETVQPLGRWAGWWQRKEVLRSKLVVDWDRCWEELERGMDCAAHDSTLRYARTASP